MAVWNLSHTIRSFEYCIANRNVVQLSLNFKLFGLIFPTGTKSLDATNKTLLSFLLFIIFDHNTLLNVGILSKSFESFEETLVASPNIWLQDSRELGRKLKN